MRCPHDGREMDLRKVRRTATIRGRTVTYLPNRYVCPKCGIEAESPELAATNQKRLSEAYKKAEGLLTAVQIVEARRRRGWTQEDLARVARVGVASVKRWELGSIQSKANDEALRRALFDRPTDEHAWNGGRPLSLDRMRLILERFSQKLRRRLLTTRSKDKLLYAGKYLFYADMVAFRETGRGMTGASYAALPHGPQVNNYSELLPLIRSAKPNAAEPLTDEEERIIDRITKRFPSNSSIYEASHLEPVWREKPTGALIPYSDSVRLKAL
ncbi:putative zinc finger/helix-turn-helix protein, YgiT family [Desulfacinum infernum DSM 9756]|uniref:Putative zinc finger/helix-turn-helix protein, YgiT family n=2 Tax=Desulfacinum infernum TaxID=35837 RepID=A0A1M4YII1_9BACT|nr:type II TA system antitoxin MqsA family protein [Desulfacinum infernum]SHF05332.1 putative zinc finger/helix-turn-helix protein, YgiT family [Desulfacinum infernum DSM 9756]